jgi:hypothetical protein
MTFGALVKGKPLRWKTGNLRRLLAVILGV